MTPDKYTLEETMLPVGGHHKLYVHLWGNKKSAHVIMYLHGGPGSGTGDSAKTFFYPNEQKVIFFDQRGSGKSTPKGELKDNNTDKLVEDITRILDHYKVDKVTLVGGSWGACLALAYGIRHPERIRRIVIRGIFTANRDEIAYLDKGHFRLYYPEVWERYENSVPEEFRADPTSYHLKVIFDQKSDREAIKRSAYAMHMMEGSHMSLDDRLREDSYEEYEPESSIVEQYYLKNACFLTENYIFDNAHKLTMPVALVQGRYDTICPPKTAYDLHKKLPKGRLIWTVGGHAGQDRANWEAIRLLLMTD